MLNRIINQTKSYITLVICVFLLSVAVGRCNRYRDELKVYKQNTSELLRETSIYAKQVSVENKQLRTLFPMFLDSLRLKYGIKPAKVETVHVVKWNTHVDTMYVPTEKIVTDTLLPAGERWKLDTLCISQEYIREQGETTGRLLMQRKMEVNIVGFKRRPKPKFWNWIKGRWDAEILVTSPCFPDTTITENILYQNR